MFTPAQFLRSCCGQRPSNQVDRDTTVTGEVGTGLHGGKHTCDFIHVQYVPQDVIVGVRFKSYILQKVMDSGKPKEVKGINVEY
jgi:hypothetical protein